MPWCDAGYVWLLAILLSYAVVFISNRALRRHGKQTIDEASKLVIESSVFPIDCPPEGY
jgi:cbb3-type cytochrome oxidase subunit 3